MKMQRRSKLLHFEMAISDEDAWPERSARERGGRSRRGAGKPRAKAAGAGNISKLNSFSRLLSGRNVELLKLIKDAQPQSIAELARLSGRPKASLMMTLRRFHAFGIVNFVETGGPRKIPVLACDRLRIDIRFG